MFTTSTNSHFHIIKSEKNSKNKRMVVAGFRLSHNIQWRDALRIYRFGQGVADITITPILSRVKHAGDFAF